MRPSLLIVIASLALGAATPEPQKILVTRVFPQPGQIGLFVAAADGTGERPLVAPADVDYDAVWAPDGASIVFTSERNGSADLYRVKPDGSGLERLTDTPAYDDQAAFSPDGRQLVFVTTRRGGTADLWTMDLQTRRARALTSGPGGDFRPSWSPDGRWIAFSSDRSSTLPFARGRWEHLHLVGLFIVRPDGSGLKRLTEPGGFCGSPKWTPDSRRVIGYCMTAEQTLDNRRAVPEHPEDTRIVAVDIESGLATDLSSGPGVKFNPSMLPGGILGYIRRDGSEEGIHYSNGTRGPKGQIRTAAWSPDGTRVVFHKRVAFERKPWVKTWSRNPGYELTLTNGGPSFSPAGDRFAFVGPAEKAMGAGVAVASVGGVTSQVVYRDPKRNVLGPQWSPDGERIIFGLGVFNAFFNGFHGLFLKPEDRTEGGAQVAMVNPDGSGFRELTSGPNNNGFPSMSPDGRRFVYRTFGPEGEGLRVMDIATKNVTALSNGYDNFPLWSPRGDLIMFSRQAQGDYEIYTIKPDGTGVKRLTSSRGNDAHMAWSPDGAHIVFASTRMGFKDEMTYTDAPQPYGEIFVMRADGSNVEQLTDNQWEEGTPAWQPARRGSAKEDASPDLKVGPVEHPFTIVTLSARPDMTSGGDVLVRVSAAPGVPLEQIRVSVNGDDVTSAFRRDESSDALVGLASGLKGGPNVLAVWVNGRAGNGGARLTVMNHPIAGPIFSGPHEQPFICETEHFKLPSGETLGKPLDRNCSIARRVDYYYRSTGGGSLKPLGTASTPPDLAETTTLDGATVPYVVRIETGTINRAIYQLSMLHNPASEKAPDPWVRPAGWNRRLIYTHGGGCTNGWYRQGSTTGGVDDDVMLRQGYAVASASLNVFGNNCNDLLASETMMMVKERFIEAYGPPKFTIGWGCSGGSYQQLQTADNYPGLLDGIIPCRTFPDVAFGTVPVITDARLLNHYFSSPASVPFSDDQKRAVVGFLTLATMANVDKSAAGRIQVLEFCPPELPVALRYHATSNPKGARCDVYDHAVNAYGKDPKTGFARRPLDNVGVQYGLRALNAGSISKEQFLDLNERIGGFDNDGDVVSSRSEGDLAAIRAAYRTGRLTSGGGGLASTPTIDYRNYLDDRKDGDVHLRYHSFSLRERLVKANGHADNHVMIVEDQRGGSSASPIYREALGQMDRWLTKLSEDTSKDPQIVKIARAKPADLTDACWSRDQTPQKIAEKQTRDPSSRCAQIYPTASFPREIAGASVASDIIKCRLEPIQPSDYKVEFTSDEMARLRKTFSSGVCDWTKPGVEQQKLAGTWLKSGGT